MNRQHSMQKLPDPATEPTITIARAASVLGIGLRTAYAAAERGELPALHVGRCVRVPTRRFLEKYDLVAPVVIRV